MRWGRMIRSCIPRQPLVVLGLMTLWLWDSPRSEAARSELDPLVPKNRSTLVLRVPPAQDVDEGELLRITVQVEGGRPGTRVFAEGMPPGARWDEPSRTLTFQPDFIQGGTSHEVTFSAVDGADTARERMKLTIQDTLHTPEPRIIQREELPGSVRLTLEQTTDTWLDSPGYAGRTFAAVVTVPLAATAGRRLPVTVTLHGVGNWPPVARTSPDRFVIEPSDPHLTYWWGYSENLPKGPAVEGRIPPYTARRVLALLEWVLRSYPGADPHRVFVEGDSMGGAGALSLGLLDSRHFAGVFARHAQPVARAHRPWRLAQLASLWGMPEEEVPEADGLGVWSRLDMTRALRDDTGARAQFLFLEHGKDDPIIHFGSVVGPSTLTGASFYDTLQLRHIGHVAVWDEGGHTEPDPWLGARWWDRGWNPRSDPKSFLRRDLAFPAFSRSTWDGDPGRGGNGRQPRRLDSGYAGDPKVAGDTGWDGDVAGMINRSLRWDATRLVDSTRRFVMPLRAVRGAGVVGTPVVDVTPRRVQRFQCLPGERIRWTFGAAHGTVIAAPDGGVTVPRLQMDEDWTPLVLERS
ncbi:hypothetical protein MEBOL_004131 [Melittangium boletus DSM 14713]|uniref:Peptidase S9 prolyl oligopeptidase catalytic domain-containing protein n=2 Tax=Melittangium boletus TaxID=83453 RepID=A0A250IHH2_9BACT|nr:hypothetical protein MEBOL_004131 [Melittangium boletus DSM 14713]